MEIYMDHAATTAMHPSVLQEMEPYFTEKYYCLLYTSPSPRDS